MKNMNSSKRQSKPSRRKKEPLRILVKCSWNGVRITANDGNLTEYSTIMDVISSVASELPSTITSMSSDTSNDKETVLQPSVVYMRTSVLQQDWERTQLKKLLGEDAEKGGSILLTVKLPSSKNISTLTNDIDAETDKKMKTVASLSDEMEMSSSFAKTQSNIIPPSSSIPETAAMNIDSEAMTNVQNSESKEQRSLSTEEAVRLLLASNFDSDSIETIHTLLKVLDNIISKPGDAKVRSLKMSNATVDRKIVSRKGGLEVLFSLGFEYTYLSTPAFEFAANPLETDSSTTKPEAVTLNSIKEDTQRISSARQLLAQALVNDLGVPQKDVPNAKKPTSVSSTTGSKPAVKFDPFKSHAFNSQAAALGAPNPNSIIPDNDSSKREKSTTERQLEKLKTKKENLEEKIQSESLNRGIIAFLPGAGSDISLLRPDREEVANSEGKGDASLLAGYMKRKEEERKKREEGGFTTKAMRDLEKIKNTKVYSHVQLRICFPDGCSLTASFLPKETISTVKEVIASTFTPELQSEYKFDIYVAPPRRILMNSNSLAEEQLVPAAKIHVSWNKSPATSTLNPGSFIQKHLFQDATLTQFPDSKSISEPTSKNNETNVKRQVESSNVSSKSALEKEEDLIQRMMGKRKGFLGKKTKTSKKEGGGGKPKWFKG